MSKLLQESVNTVNIENRLNTIFKHIHNNLKARYDTSHQALFA